MKALYLGLCISILMMPSVVIGQSNSPPAEPLTASTEVDAQPAVTEAAAQQEKRICRSEKMTGSLTRRIRTCMTQAQWDRQAEGTQRNADRFARDANRHEANNCRANGGQSCY